MDAPYIRPDLAAGITSERPGASSPAWHLDATMRRVSGASPRWLVCLFLVGSAAWRPATRRLRPGSEILPSRLLHPP